MAYQRFLEFLQTRYTLGQDVHHNTYHIDIIREKLTRSIPTILSDVIDELALAVGEHIPTRDDSTYPYPSVVACVLMYGRTIRLDSCQYPAKSSGHHRTCQQSGVCRPSCVCVLAIQISLRASDLRLLIRPKHGISRPCRQLHSGRCAG